MIMEYALRRSTCCIAVERPKAALRTSGAKSNTMWNNGLASLRVATTAPDAVRAIGFLTKEVRSKRINH
jgi:hypothetical protein